MPNVTVMLACPRIVCASRAGTPRLLSNVAVVRRRSWKTIPGRPAAGDDPVEGTRQVAGFDRAAGAGGEDVAGVLPVALGVQALIGLPVADGAERGPGERHERQDTE